MKFIKSSMVLLCLIIAFTFTSCSSSKLSGNTTDNPSSAPQENKTSSNDVVATIAGMKITAPEFKFYLSMAKSNMLSQNNVSTSDPNAVQAFWKAKTGNDDNATLAKNKGLDSIIELKILLDKASQEKIQLDNNDLSNVKSFMDSAIKQQGNGDKAQAEKNIMASIGINLTQYESIYKDYMLAYQKYANDAVSKIDVTDKDIKDFYDKNASRYNKVTVKHILIMTQDSSTGKDLAADKLAEKKKLADDVFKKAQSGENFENLVKQYSEDPGSKDKGGEYTFGKGEMVQEFENWSFNAKPGDIGMVKSVYGYHIIKFIKKADFDSQKDTIKKDTQTDKFKQKLEEWKKDDKYKIDVNQKVMDSVAIF